MNEHDELLSIPKVRERVIGDRPLNLNSAANWNHGNQVRIEEYLYNYMVKNLYALEYFYESDGVSKAILLLPLDYEGIILRTRRSNPACTDNPDLFWTITK